MKLEARQYWGEADRQWDLDGLSVTYTRYPALQRQLRHCHENPTYFFLLGGDFTDESDQLGSQTPKRFDLLFHPAEAWHEGSSGPRGRFGLNFEPSRGWLEKYGLTTKDLGEYRLVADPFRAGELLRLAVCGLETDLAETQILEMLLPAEPVANEAPTWFAKLGRLLDAEVSWSLRSLAEELSVHPVYLARIFRSRFGCSVSEWLRRKRLVECAKSLIDGRSSSEIAYEEGFSDQSHFGRTFRAYFNCTPGEFRRRWTQ